MRNLLYLLILFIPLHAQALSLDLPDGESSDVEVYSGDDKKYAIIYLHGKASKPVIGHVEEMFNIISGDGYSIYAPEMPWGREKYRGTQKTANAIIDQLVTIINARGKRAILMGHSMGASYALIYAGQYSDKLAGSVPIALGHVPHWNDTLEDTTADSVALANKMVASGKGKQTSAFKDLNKGKSYEIEATAEYYQSFYDLATFPDVSKRVKQVTIPTLWISGEQDYMTALYDHKELFNMIPANKASSYKLLEGKHMSVLHFSAEVILEWLNDL